MSSFAFSKKIALRYLWSKRSEAFISIISIISVAGIAIGVMVLCIVMAVMTGFEHELREKIVGTDSHIIVRKLGEKVTGWREIRDKISHVPGVVSVSPYTSNQALLRANDRASGILIRGVEEGSAGADQLSHFLRGSFSLKELFTPPAVSVVSPDSGKEESATLPGIVLGRELCTQLGLIAGTPLSILSPTVGSTPFGLIPRFKRFVVVGSYSSGLVEYDSSLAYVPLAEAQRFFQMGDAVNGFEVRVKVVDDAPRIAQEIVSALGGLSSGLYAQDWTERNKPLWNAIHLEKRVYFIVLLLIIVMASFSIVTTLIMIVLEKRRDIAIMKTLGASANSIALIFCTQGAIIGFTGTLSGLLLGFLGCEALKTWGFPLDERVFQMSTLPIQMEPLNFLVIGIAAFLIGCGATIYPAFRASGLKPSDAFRFE